MNIRTFLQYSYKNKKTFQTYNNCRRMDTPLRRGIKISVSFDQNRLFIKYDITKMNINKLCHEDHHIIYILN